eukprot:CAMPEP_0181348360 /NCGR_PEP_ID=MMETSP1106-20121128/131_1 /TAXON_ID=81844 /ORGANISM="Mantoniella antarctica, Strain SL-175" /LENGTH=164 /DNA_ID=CAMNT_0023460641 /DNA_START=357 /DNA_END=851 /DNA_ORIENTATION=-
MTAPLAYLVGSPVHAKGVRGFGARAGAPPRNVAVAVSAVFSRTDGAAEPRLESKTEATTSARQSNTFGQPRVVAPVSAVELWRAAQNTRAAAKRMTSFAVLSAHGAAFAQLQTNAQMRAMWAEAGNLEEAAFHAWEIEKSLQAEAVRDDLDPGDDMQGGFSSAR